MSETKLVVIYTATTPLEAQVIKSKLEAAGIPAMLEYESGAVMMGLMIDGWGEHRILVHADRVDEARALLED